MPFAFPVAGCTAPFGSLEGFTKNIRAAFEGSFAGYVLIAVTQLCCFLLPCIALFLPTHHRLQIAGQVALIYVIRVILTRRFQTSWLSCIFHPVGHALALAIGFNSWRKMAAGGVTWKGRVYRSSMGLE